MVRFLYELENSLYKGLTKPCITLQGLLIVFRCNIFILSVLILHNSAVNKHTIQYKTVWSIQILLLLLSLLLLLLL